MKIPNRIVGCTILLFLASFTVLYAESITTLYDINFNTPIHIVGQPPTSGPFEPACDVVQFGYNLPLPVIVDSLGDLVNQPCLFQVDPNVMDGYNASVISLKMDDWPDAQDYPRYKIEMDVLIESLVGSAFEIDFDCGRIGFFEDGVSPLKMSYPLGQAIHIVIDIDLEIYQYVISMDGLPIYTREFSNYNDFSSMADSTPKCN